MEIHHTIEVQSAHHAASLLSVAVLRNWSRSQFTG
jgi:hypothetical protein